MPGPRLDNPFAPQLLCCKSDTDDVSEKAARGLFMWKDQSPLFPGRVNFPSDLVVGLALSAGYFLQSSPTVAPFYTNF